MTYLEFWVMALNVIEYAVLYYVNLDTVRTCFMCCITARIVWSWCCLYLFRILHHCKNCVILILFVLVSCTASQQESCDFDTVCTCFIYCITARIVWSWYCLYLFHVLHHWENWEVIMDGASWSPVDCWLALYYSSRWHLGRNGWYIGKSVKHQVAPCNKFISCVMQHWAGEKMILIIVLNINQKLCERKVGHCGNFNV